jgi:2Fe-2S ferredoxin
MCGAVETFERVMPRIVFVLADGERRAVDAAARSSIMLTAIDTDIPGIVAECGGACACATCHVYIDPAHLDRLPEVSPMEREMLEGVASDKRPGSRLSCQIQVSDALDGLVVHIPDRQY